MEIKEKDKKTLDEFLDIIEQEEDAVNFLTPVQWREMELMNYPDIIKEPMDLGTVRSTLNKMKYSSIEELQAGINLIWENCMTFNFPDSSIYQ